MEENSLRNLDEVLNNLQSGQLLLGKNYQLLTQTGESDGQLQVDLILKNLLLGKPLRGFDYVVLAEFLGDKMSATLGYGDKKHFIKVQKFVSNYMRQSIMTHPAFLKLKSFQIRHYLPEIKALYQNKTIRLLHMDEDIAPIQHGTIGEISFVDDAGQLHVHWESGSSLAVSLEGGDVVEIVVS